MPSIVPAFDMRCTRYWRSRGAQYDVSFTRRTRRMKLIPHVCGSRVASKRSVLSGIRISSVQLESRCTVRTVEMPSHASTIWRESLNVCSSRTAPFGLMRNRKELRLSLKVSNTTPKMSLFDDTKSRSSPTVIALSGSGS